MAQFFDDINETHQRFIEAQKMFFVATAASEGRINLSPKGMDTFRVLGPNLVAYLDLAGSAAETSAHITHDGRITLMFNSFDQAPLIMRLYGRGRLARLGSEDYSKLIDLFPEEVGARQIILIDVQSVQTSCGYAVPRMDFIAERDTLRKSAERKGREGVLQSIQDRNLVSIDGLSTGLEK